MDSALGAAQQELRRRTRTSGPTSDSSERRQRTTSTRRTPSAPRERTRATSSPESDRSLRATYAPLDNGLPDPGEIVWAWVPYEEDASRGKDRPVLVLDVDHEVVHALQLTSKDHDRDSAQEAAAGRYWMDIGSGDWDRQGRPSEVRLNRLLTLPVDSVRREGAALDRQTYQRVIDAARPFHR